MSDQTAKVLVIGAAGVDIVGRLESELQNGTSNPAQIRTSYGGVARNVAENLARLGQHVTLLTAVGADRSGDDILAHTSEAGVDVAHALRVAEVPSGFYMGLLNQKRERLFALDDMRITTHISADYLERNEAAFAAANLLFVDANLPVAALRMAIKLARRHKLSICADPTSSSVATRLQPHLKHIKLITPNAAEAAALTGTTFQSSERSAALEAARALVNAGVKLALVTLDAFGVCYATSETSGYIPAIRTQITDPVGAGDALTAAVIFGLLHEMDTDEAVRLGVSAASLTMRQPGTVHPELSLEKLYDQLL